MSRGTARYPAAGASVVPWFHSPRVTDRRNAVPCRAGLVVLVGLLVATALGGYSARRWGEGPRCPDRSAAVVLDPGHGGADSGAVSDAYGLIERDLTLAIARRTAALLRADGVRVALTRNDAATALGNSERGLIANACRAAVYVSIHLNSFGEPAPNYVKTFWGVAAKDIAFARSLQAAMTAELRPDSDLGDGGVEQLENGGLLRAHMPAVLVEPVFLSNPDEAARLAAPDGARLEQIAVAIARGIAAWLGVKLTVGAASDSAPRVATDEGSMLAASDSLLGPARGSPAEAIAAAEVAGAHRLPEVRAYIEEVYRLAPLVGLDPAIVLAQSAHETGFWRSDAWGDHLNPAGIGVTAPGVPSPSWSNGTAAARAHIVHLYLYAAGAVGPDHLLAPYQGLDPRYEAAMEAGRAASARTVADLTRRWATDPGYAAGIVRAGNALFEGPQGRDRIDH